MFVLVMIIGKFDLEMFQLEINYIGVYVIYCVKELEECLWSIGVCVYVVDIIDEVLLCFGFDLQEVQVNY